MRGVFDPALLAIGGANQSVTMPAMLLNFQMQRSLRLHNGYDIRHNRYDVKAILNYYQFMYGYK